MEGKITAASGAKLFKTQSLDVDEKKDSGVEEKSLHASMEALKVANSDVVEKKRAKTGNKHYHDLIRLRKDFTKRAREVMFVPENIEEDGEHSRTNEKCEEIVRSKSSKNIVPKLFQR